MFTPSETYASGYVRAAKCTLSYNAGSVATEVTNPPNSGKSQTADCDGEGQCGGCGKKTLSCAPREHNKGHWCSSTKHIAYGPAGRAIGACAAWCTSALFSGDDETCAVAAEGAAETPRRALQNDSKSSCS